MLCYNVIAHGKNTTLDFHILEKIYIIYNVIGHGKKTTLDFHILENIIYNDIGGKKQL